MVTIDLMNKVRGEGRRRSLADGGGLKETEFGCRAGDTTQALKRD